MQEQLFHILFVSIFCKLYWFINIQYLVGLKGASTDPFNITDTFPQAVAANCKRTYRNYSGYLHVTKILDVMWIRSFVKCVFYVAGISPLILPSFLNHPQSGQVWRICYKWINNNWHCCLYLKGTSTNLIELESLVNYCINTFWL